MANTKLATKDNAISLEGATQLVASVKDGLKLVSQGYLAITPDVAKLYDCKGYKALGYKNFDEMCALEFGMSHGTTVGIRKVFKQFGTVSKENKYSIPDKYLEYGYTKLLLFTDTKFEKAGINPIEEFEPTMTMAEMRDKLATALEAKADKQENDAIDTTATEVADNDNTSGEASDNSKSIEPTEISSLDLIESLLSENNILRSRADGIIDKSKMALLDAIEANLKELKTEFKKRKIK